MYTKGFILCWLLFVLVLGDYKFLPYSHPISVPFLPFMVCFQPLSGIPFVNKLGYIVSRLLIILNKLYIDEVMCNTEHICARDTKKWFCVGKEDVTINTNWYHFPCCIQLLCTETLGWFVDIHPFGLFSCAYHNLLSAFFPMNILYYNWISVTDDMFLWDNTVSINLIYYL